MDLRLWILTGYIALVNILSFVLMGVDKARAISRGCRISESTFYILSLLQGYIGVLIGSIVFHHKTRKISFQLINLFMFIDGVILTAALLMFLHIL